MQYTYATLKALNLTSGKRYHNNINAQLKSGASLSSLPTYSTDNDLKHLFIMFAVILFTLFGASMFLCYKADKLHESNCNYIHSFNPAYVCDPDNLFRG